MTTSVPPASENSPASQTREQNEEMENQQPELAAAPQIPSTSENTDSSQAPPSTTVKAAESSPPTAPSTTTDAADQVTVPSPAVVHEHEAKPSSSASEPFAPITITLLSSMSGHKSNFILNSEYLQRHKLNVPEPLAMSAYNLKECIWRDWKEDEMDKRPAGAHLIRLIFFGRLLEDRSVLKDYRFHTDSANVIHLSLKPSENGNEDDATTKTGKGFGLGMNRRTGTPTCRCVIL